MEKNILKSKAGFMSRNGVVLYNMGDTINPSTGNSYDEDLLGILLSDKPLTECKGFDGFRMLLAKNKKEDFLYTKKQNYGRLVFNRLCMNVNETFADVEEERKACIEKIRPYSGFLRETIISDGITFQANIVKTADGKQKLLIKQF